MASAGVMFPFDNTDGFPSYPSDAGLEWPPKTSSIYADSLQGGSNFFPMDGILSRQTYEPSYTYSNSLSESDASGVLGDFDGPPSSVSSRFPRHSVSFSTPFSRTPLRQTTASSNVSEHSLPGGSPLMSGSDSRESSEGGRRYSDDGEGSDVHRSKRKRDSFGAQISIPQNLTEDQKLLLQLRDEQNMPWKDIAARFQSDLGRSDRVPALQMRYKRLKERLRVWTDADVEALKQAYHFWETRRFEIISEKMLEFGVLDKWPARHCALKWQELTSNNEAPMSYDLSDNRKFDFNAPDQCSPKSQGPAGPFSMANSYQNSPGLGPNGFHPSNSLSSFPSLSNESSNDSMTLSQGLPNTVSGFRRSSEKPRPIVLPTAKPQPRQYGSMSDASNMQLEFLPPHFTQSPSSRSATGL